MKGHFLLLLVGIQLTFYKVEYSEATDWKDCYLGTRRNNDGTMNWVAYEETRKALERNCSQLLPGGFTDKAKRDTLTEKVCEKR